MDPLVSYPQQRDVWKLCSCYKQAARGPWRPTVSAPARGQTFTVWMGFCLACAGDADLLGKPTLAPSDKYILFIETGSFAQHTDVTSQGSCPPRRLGLGCG